MKKKAYLVVLALCTALAFTACGTTTDKKRIQNLQQKHRIRPVRIRKIQDQRILTVQIHQIKMPKLQFPEIQDLFLWMM